MPSLNHWLQFSITHFQPQEEVGLPAFLKMTKNQKLRDLLMKFSSPGLDLEQVERMGVSMMKIAFSGDGSTEDLSLLRHKILARKLLTAN